MSCDHWRERIDTIVDDGGEPEASLADHLQTCAECRRYQEEVRRADAALRQGVGENVFPSAPGLEDRILRNLREARQASVQSASSRGNIIPLRGLAAAMLAAAAALLLWLAVGGGLWNEDAAEPVPETPSVAQNDVLPEDGGDVDPGLADAEETDPFLWADTALAYGPRVEADRLRQDLAGVGAFLQAAFPVPQQVD